MQNASSVQSKKLVHTPFTFSTFLASLFSGGLSGIVSKSVVAPIERVKMIYQTSNVDFSFRTSGTLVVNLMKEEGVWSLWKGNSASALRCFPYSGIQFLSYRGYGNLLRVDDFTPLSKVKQFVAGASAGLTATTLTYPLDFLGTRMALRSRTGTYGSILAAAKSIQFLEGNSVPFFRGISASLIGVVPYSGLAWMTFELLKDGTEKMINQGNPITVIQRGCCAALSAVCSQSATYPLDLVRKRLQSEMHSHDHNRFAVFKEFSSVIKEHGVAGLWKGLSLNIVKGPISMGMSFVCYELFEKWFQKMSF